MKKKKPVCSAIHIARLLDCEGFTDHTAGVLTRFAKRGMTERQAYVFRKIKQAMRDTTANLSEGDKRVLGRFIALHKAISFQTGLKMGLAGAIVTKPIELSSFLDGDDLVAAQMANNHEAKGGGE